MNVSTSDDYQPRVRFPNPIELLELADRDDSALLWMVCSVAFATLVLAAASTLLP